MLDRDAIAPQVTDAYAVAGLNVDALPETVAPLQRLITAYGLTVDEVDGLTRLTALRHLAVQPMIAEDMSTEMLAGFLFANAAGGWILVERHDPLVRRRFTVAHELGHYLLHYLPELAAMTTSQDKDLLEFEEQIVAPTDRTDENENGSGRSTLSTDLADLTGRIVEMAERERQADAFAADLLMPEVICKRLVAKHSDRGIRQRAVLARLLASECLVSRAAMSRRLDDLKLAKGIADGR